MFIFPSLVPKTSYKLPLTIRIVAPLAVFAIGGYWLIRPLLPNRALTNAKVEVIRRKMPAGAPLSLEYLGPGFAGNVKEADTYSSVSRLEFTTDGKNQARVLLIIDDPQPVAHTFVLPRTGTAVYRQSHGVWEMEQSNGKPSDISVTLTAFNSTLQTEGPCCSFTAASFAPYR